MKIAYFNLATSWSIGLYLQVHREPTNNVLGIKCHFVGRLELLFWQRRGGFSCRPTQRLFVREYALVRSSIPGGDTGPPLYNPPSSVDETNGPNPITRERKGNHNPTKRTWWRLVSRPLRRRSLKKRSMKTRSLYHRLTWVDTLCRSIVLFVVHFIVSQCSVSVRKYISIVY